MFTIEDYLNTVSRTIDCLRQLLNIVSEDDAHSIFEIKREIAVLVEIREKLWMLNTNIAFITVH
jgi:hypothetical protein